MNAISRLWEINLRENRQHKVRATVSVVIVGVSIALIVAVFGTYGSVTGSVNDLSKRISGSADLEIAGITDTGFSQSLVDNVRSVRGVVAAAPILRMRVRTTAGDVLFLGVDNSIQQLKSDLQQAIHEELSDATVLANTVVVGPQLAHYVGHDFSIDKTPVQIGSVLSGKLAHEINSGDFAITSLEFAQRLTERVGTIDSILVAVDAHASAADVGAQISAAVSGRALVVDPLYRTEQAQAATALTRNSTMVIALIALVVATFLIFNSMNMAVAERRRTIATLRALGVRRSKVSRDLIAEAVVVALAGGVLGVPLGIILGREAIGTLPPTVVQSFDATIHYVLPVYAVPIAMACGIGACVLATSAAARDVFVVAPIEALGSSKIPDMETGGRRLRIIFGVIGAVLIIGSVAGIQVVESQRAVTLAAVLVAGILALCFAFSSMITGVASTLSQRVPATGELVKETMERSPRRVWATAMTVAIAIGVGQATSGAMSNLVSSVAKNLAPASASDLYVTTTAVDVLPTGPLDPSVVDLVRRDNQVRTVVPGQYAYMNLNNLRIVLVGVTEGSRAVLFAELPPRQQSELLDGKGVVLSTQLAQRLGLKAGDTINMPSPTGVHGAHVLAVEDYISLDPGAIAMPLWQLEQWFQRRDPTYLEVEVAEKTSVTDVKNRLAEILRDRAVLYTGSEAAAETKVGTSQVGALAVSLQWIIALVAAVALFNTFTLSVLKRKPELGVLQAMGAKRSFVIRLILTEAVAVGVVGAILGLGMGFATHYLADVVLSATTALHIHFSLSPFIVLFAVGAMALCLLGAVPPAVAAARSNIVESVSEE